VQITNSPRRSFARGFYVPDVKMLPKMLCLVVSWMSFLDGICAGKPRLDRLSHFLLRFASTHPVAVRNEVPFTAQTSKPKSQQLFLSIPCFRIRNSPLRTLLLPLGPKSCLCCRPSRLTFFYILVLQWKLASENIRAPEYIIIMAPLHYHTLT
jgi:hypothetical protein